MFIISFSIFGKKQINDGRYMDHLAPIVTAGQVSLVNTHVLYRPISLQSKHIHI